MIDLFPLFETTSLDLGIKIFILFLIFLFMVFMFIALVNVRALNRLVLLESGRSSFIIQAIFAFYFLLIVSLFLLALAIL